MFNEITVFLFMAIVILVVVKAIFGLTCPGDRMSVHRSSAWPLTWVALTLITYATLHPWNGWHWPEPQAFSWVLPKLPHEVLNDLIGNLLGYLPLGWSCAWPFAQRCGVLRSALMSVAFGSGWSYGLELIQYTLPARVPSISDWTLNTLGAAWGAGGGHDSRPGGGRHLAPLAREMVHPGGRAWSGTDLDVAAGPVVSPPLPLGQGQLWPTLRLHLVEWTHDTPWQSWLLPDDPLMLWGQLHETAVRPGGWGGPKLPLWPWG